MTLFGQRPTFEPEEKLTHPAHGIGLAQGEVNVWRSVAATWMKILEGRKQALSEATTPTQKKYAAAYVAMAESHVLHTRRMQRLSEMIVAGDAGDVVRAARGEPVAQVHAGGSKR